MKLLHYLALFALLVILLLTAACRKTVFIQVPKPEPTPPAASGPLLGVSLSPRTLAPADFTAFFVKAVEAGDAVTWAGDWADLSREGSAPHVVATLAAQYRYTPVIMVQFFQQSTGQLLRPLDGKTRQTYIDSAAAFAEKYRPAYLGIGIEVNILFEKSPADFNAFVTLFGEVRDAVKRKSPSTQVFTVFQLERMKGLHGGLFGGVNDPALAQWPLLDRFPQADIVAFTTYPGLIYGTPAEIPSDYYTDVLARTSKPVAFTEIGWHASADITGWESSDAEQAAFVARFFTLTRDVKPSLDVWSFLYDPQTVRPFNSMGLLRSDGTSRPALQEWIEAP